MKRLEDIDKLVAGKIGQWEAGPPPQSYAEISKRMKWVNFWKFGVLRIMTSNKILSITASLLFITVLSIYFYSDSDKSFNIKKMESRSSHFLNFPNQIAEMNQFESANLNTEKEKKHSKENVLKSVPYDRNEPDNNHLLSSQLTESDTKEPDSRKILSFENDSYEQFISQNLTSSHRTEESEKINTLHENNSDSELITKKDEIGDSKMKSVHFDNTLKLMPLAQYKIPEHELSRKNSYSKISGNRWTTSAGLSVGVHSLIRPPSFYNNDLYSSSGIVNGTTINADFHFENQNIAIISGIGFSSFNQHFNAENLIYNPHTDIQYNLSGSILNIDSVGLWHYYYISDSVVHFVDSVWSWSVDSSIVHLYDTNYVNQSDTMEDIQWTTHFQQITIPLLLSRKFATGRFAFSVTGGLSLGIFKATQGYVLFSEQSAYPLVRSFPEIILQFLQSECYQPDIF